MTPLTSGRALLSEGPGRGMGSTCILSGLCHMKVVSLTHTPRNVGKQALQGWRRRVEGSASRSAQFRLFSVYFIWVRLLEPGCGRGCRSVSSGSGSRHRQLSPRLFARSPTSPPCLGVNFSRSVHPAAERGTGAVGDRGLPVRTGVLDDLTQERQPDVRCEGAVRTDQTNISC